jgi:cytochrome bd-type quinol oxidase subunit 1
MILVSNLHVLGVFSSVVLVAAFLIASFSYIGGSDEEKEMFRPVLKVLSFITVFALILAVAFPSMAQMRESFIMTELAKIGTAENAKIVAERIETLIKLFAEKK